MPSTSTHSVLLHAKDIGLTINGQSILEQVNLTISAGEIVTIVGPNGAGKSSLIKTLIGIQKPTQGRIHRKPSLTIGYMPQKLSIDDSLPLDVYRLMTLTRTASLDDAVQALARTGVEHLIHRSVQHLSGGEFQRVMLARALLAKPDILVLDEPAQGVDFNGEVELYELIQKLRTELGCAIVMVSHDLHIVMAATDQVICLNKHICCSGHPESVSQHPEFTQLFGKEFAPALAVYTHEHDHTHDLGDCGGHHHD
ncbi:zinc ABC transporter ATP-binding protein ZnuC [Reinekea forsetii]|nr:zinc ABC transporter ATP-binding protein ZnuC [Reinekea forsetii]